MWQMYIGILREGESLLRKSGIDVVTYRVQKDKRSALLCKVPRGGNQQDLVKAQVRSEVTIEVRGTVG
jgi:hypothetical protein